MTRMTAFLEAKNSVIAVICVIAAGFVTVKTVLTVICAPELTVITVISVIDGIGNRHFAPFSCPLQSDMNSHS